MPLNIVVVNDFAHINGGASKIAIKTAIGLKKRGYDVIFFSAVPPIEVELKRSEIITINTNQYDILSHPNRLSASIQGLWNKKAANYLSELLNKLNPLNTILHFHSWMKALSPSVLSLAIKREFKILITIHDYFLFCPNGGFFNFKKNDICHETLNNIRCIIKNCDSRNYYHKIWRAVRHLIQYMSLKNLNRNLNFIFPSDFSRKVIFKYFDPEGIKIFTLPNPIEISQKTPIKVKSNEAFFYVGRLSREKGVLLFAEAANRLKLKTFFLGDGYLRNNILKICPDGVITGWMPEVKVQEFLKLARVLVYPSLCYETQGLAVLEAKSMGIPAIVSDACAAREYIEHEEDGLLFRSGDVQDLIDKLKMCNDDSLIERMGKRACDNYWKNPQTIDSYLNSLEQIYLKILENR